MRQKESSEEETQHFFHLSVSFTFYAFFASISQVPFLFSYLSLLFQRFVHFALRQYKVVDYFKLKPVVLIKLGKIFSEFTVWRQLIWPLMLAVSSTLNYNLHRRSAKKMATP